MTGNRIGVVIADEQPMIRAALRIAILGSRPDAQVFEAGSFSVFQQTLIAVPRAALVLLDVVLPGAADYQALVHLHEVHPALRFAAVTALDAQASASVVRGLGGVGFIHKLTPYDEVRSALRRLLSGQEYWPDAAHLRDGGSAAPDADRLAQLSARELGILLMIRAGGMNKQIAEGLAISESTVKIHVSSILRKLNASTRTQAAILAQRLLSGDALADRHEDQSASPGFGESLPRE